MFYYSKAKVLPASLQLLLKSQMEAATISADPAKVDADMQRLEERLAAGRQNHGERIAAEENNQTLGL